MVVAPSEGSSAAAFIAASYATLFAGLTAATRRVPSLPGSPLNFCQSPVTLSRAATASDGCAPTPSQY